VADAVTLVDVVKRYGDVEAVRGVSMSIKRGEFVVLMGPSGCGKTTTLRLIAGLEVPTSGTISIGGEVVNDRKPWKRDTPLVWQNFALFPFLNVRKNVEYGLKMRNVPRGQRRDKVDRVLTMVGIEHLSERKVSQLSGGEMQRVGLARAVVTEPSVLLLDEPLASLDAHLRVRMQSELRGLQQELGITFVYVTHSQSEALSMADRIVVMRDGRIQQIGTPRQIYREPENRFVAEFVSANAILSGRVAAVGPREIEVATSMGRFTVAVPDGPVPQESEEVSFVVYADRISTEFDGVEHENRAVGVLRGREYVGATVSYVLELPDGTELMLQKPERESLRLPTELGAPLGVSWEADAAFLLPWKRTEATG
jgi:spermidine/putrescine transport system ATP-binding protein